MSSNILPRARWTICLSPSPTTRAHITLETTVVNRRNFWVPQRSPGLSTGTALPAETKPTTPLTYNRSVAAGGGNELGEDTHSDRGQKLQGNERSPENPGSLTDTDRNLAPALQNASLTSASAPLLPLPWLASTRPRGAPLSLYLGVLRMLPPHPRERLSDQHISTGATSSPFPSTSCLSLPLLLLSSASEIILFFPLGSICLPLAQCYLCETRDFVSLTQNCVPKAEDHSCYMGGKQ